MNKERKGVRTRRSCATGRRTRANAANAQLAAIDSGYTPPADNATDPLSASTRALSKGRSWIRGKLNYCLPARRVWSRLIIPCHFPPSDISSTMSSWAAENSVCYTSYSTSTVRLW